MKIQTRLKVAAKRHLTLAALFSVRVMKKQPTDAVAVYILKDLVPIHSAEKEGFITFLRTVNPRHELPSHKRFAYIASPHLYNAPHVRVVEKLERVVFYATSTNLRSRHTVRLYMNKAAF